MSVSDGQPVNAAVTNAAYISRTVDSGTVAKVDLQDSGSADVIDLQNTINNLKTQSYAEQVISASGTISSDDNQYHQIRRVKSDGGVITLSTTPFGTGGTWLDGIVIEVMGTDNTDKISVTFNDIDNGAILNGDITLERFRSIKLRWDSVLLRWIELGRNL